MPLQGGKMPLIPLRAAAADGGCGPTKSDAHVTGHRHVRSTARSCPRSRGCSPSRLCGRAMWRSPRRRLAGAPRRDPPGGAAPAGPERCCPAARVRASLGSSSRRAARVRVPACRQPRVPVDREQGHVPDAQYLHRASTRRSRTGNTYRALGRTTRRLIETRHPSSFRRPVRLTAQWIWGSTPRRTLSASSTPP